MDNDYGMKTKTIRSFKYLSQPCNLEQLVVHQNTLVDAKIELSMLKFDGNLKLESSDTSQERIIYPRSY